MIVIDAVALQPNLQAPSSIIGFWLNVINEWVRLGYTQEFVVLVRESQLIGLPGDTVVGIISDFSYENADLDHIGLQSVCDQVGATLFISTLYTYPLKTPSVAVVYSIDENYISSSSLVAQEKHNTILNASAYISPSDWVASSLKSKYPGISHRDVQVIYPGLHSELAMSPPLKIRRFREERNLTRPYIIFRSGAGDKRKIALFTLLDSLGELVSGPVPELVYLSVSGSGVDIPLSSVLDLSKPIRACIHDLNFSVDDLPALYTASLGLFEIEPELGMGNYIFEAMRCGCPIVILKNLENQDSQPITVPRPWIEVPLEPHIVSRAIEQLRDPKYRSTAVTQGLEFTRNMTWEQTAQQMWFFLNQKRRQLYSLER